MSRDDLFRSLGLEDRPSKPTRNPIAIEAGEGPSASPVSAQALQLDEWDIARGQQCCERLKEQTHQPWLEETTIADFHASAFQIDPQLVDHCSDKRRLEFVKTMMDSPEYHNLHEATRSNELASEMAAFQFGQQYAQLIEKDKKRKKPRSGDKKGEERGKMRSDMDLLSAVGQAVSKAQQEVDDLNDMSSALGCGGDGGKDGRMDTARTVEMFKRVRNSDMLRRICEKAGRFRRFAQAKQRQKVSHGLDDMVGVELSGDLGRILPHELAQLTDPDLELDAMRRLVERQMMARQYRGIEKVGKGPIIGCVDESGSMRGRPVEDAKAFALSLAWIAHAQKRWCCLIGYAGGTEGTCCVLKPGKWDQEKLLDWLEHFYGGGTVLDVPLSELPNKWWPELVQQGLPQGQTDLVLITDGIVNLAPDMRDNFLAWKKVSKCRTLSLILNAEPGDLSQVSDEVYKVGSISLAESGIEKALSI